mgnify:FL=1
MKKFDHFNVVGHLDVIRRYGDFSIVPDLMDDGECQDILDEIFKVLIHKGKGLEVNTSGYYIADEKDPLPTRNVLKRYQELGGEILTTGSDSHYPEQLAYKFEETHHLLKSLGFKYLTTFDQGEPTFHTIK